MAREIEIKARISDPLSLKQRLEITSSYRNMMVIDKVDTYFSLPADSQRRFRVRFQDGRVLLTRKEKEVCLDGMESNKEIEFEALPGSYQTILDFFYSLGCTRYACKEKHGWSWLFEDITLELVEVGSLGWFLEMEILLDDNASFDQIEIARARLFHLLDELGINRSLLEGRYYTDLLLDSLQ